MNCITSNQPFCLSLSWPWLRLGAPIACPAPAKCRPCGRCGCAWDEHDHDMGGMGCMSPHCLCLGWKQPERAEETTLSTQATCADVCTCGGEHHEGSVYYVSAVRGGTYAHTDRAFSGVALILGPYESHSMALSMVETGRRLAEKVDTRACWYAYGTVAWKRDDATTGMLMADLAAEEERAREEQATIKPKRRVRATA